MSNQKSPEANKCDVHLNHDSDIAVRNINIDSLAQDDNIKHIEERMHQDQEENKRLPNKAVIGGHEFTNIRVRDMPIERNEEDENMKEIEERMRLDQEENKKLPNKAVIGGHHFTNIRVRDIPIERNEEDENMKEIEERMRLDQEENKKWPSKAVIGGHEFTNIRVREVALEPQSRQSDSKKSTTPTKRAKYCYDRSVFYQPLYHETPTRKRVCKTNKPIKLTVTLKDIGMENFDMPFMTSNNLKENELPKLYSVKQSMNDHTLAHDGSKEKELPKMANHNNISVQTHIQEPKQVSANKKSPRKKKEHVSTYDPSIFRTPIRSELPSRPVRYFNDPIKLRVTLKDIGLEGLDSP